MWWWTIVSSEPPSLSVFVHLRVYYTVFSIELYTPGNVRGWSTHISYIFKVHSPHYALRACNYLVTATHLSAFCDLLQMLYLFFSSKAPGRQKLVTEWLRYLVTNLEIRVSAHLNLCGELPPAGNVLNQNLIPCLREVVNMESNEGIWPLA